jgi:hypothetical protein
VAERFGVSRLGSLVGGLALARVLAKYPGAADAIAAALAERVREVLPADRYAVSAEGPVLDVKTEGGGASALLALMLIERGPTDHKLQLVFDEAARMLSNMIQGAYRTRYPGNAFEPHARVTSEAVTVWWGASNVDDAPVRLRPIPRAELGVS